MKILGLRCVGVFRLLFLIGVWFGDDRRTNTMDTYFNEIGRHLWKFDPLLRIWEDLHMYLVDESTNMRFS